MFRKLGYPSLLVVLSLFSAVPVVHAQSVDTGRYSRPRITHNVDDGKRVPLTGNTHPDARREENDRGKVPDDLRMEHLLLQLRRSPDQEKAVQAFIDDLHDPASPDFHKWLSVDEFGDKFGVADQDIDALTHWLRSQGFRVNVVYPSGMMIDFSGTADQVSRAFGTEIHNLEVHGKRHIGNIRDPQIPAALAPVVVGVVSLHDFQPPAMHRMRAVAPKFTFNGLYGTNYAVVPGDLATIYNLNPLFSAGYSGQGQTIALIEDTDVFRASDWNAFRSKLGLSPYTSGSFKTIHPVSPTGPNNCAKPGVIAPNDAEAILDAEWASAAAPSAAIEIVSCADTTSTFGGLIAIQNLINAKSGPPAIISISYGQCETVNGAAANAAYNSAYQQAVAEGVSVFVAAGDSGAAGCDNSASEATHGVGANAFASTPYNVAVGGTDFSDTYSGTNGIYWNSTNTSAFASATSYIPEIPWNNSCAGALLSNYLGFGVTYGASSLCNDPTYGPLLQSTVAGGGSPSACATGAPSIAGVVGGTCQGWPKPSWQRLVGNPSDGVRDTPDLSLFAADGLWSHYYVFCWSDTANGGAACTGDPSGWSGAGGTSFAAPILAGIQALVNQKLNARQGNPNPVYYQLASVEYGANGSNSCNSVSGNGVASTCVFYDVTQGDMDVNCSGTGNCYNPAGPGFQGVLSTSNNSFAPAYGTATGWDFATGIGTLNAANLVNNWPTGGLVPSFYLSTTASSMSLTQAGSGTTTIAVVPLNGFSSSVALTASGLPSGVTASFNPVSTTNTSTLTLTATSTAAIGTSTVTIAGTSGITTSTVSISLTVNPNGTYSLTASPNALGIARGVSGTSTITIAPQGGFNGSVSLSISGLPSGVTASFNPNSTNTTAVLTLNASNTASVGTFALTVTGTCSNLTSSVNLSLTVNPPANPSFPSGWFDLDMGAVGVAGSATYANGMFTLNASGQWIYSTADAMHFVYQPVSGDATIIARVVAVQGGGADNQAGVMIRETLDPASTNAFAEYEVGLIYSFVRPSPGAGTTYITDNVAVPLPYWVKLVRSGNNFSSYSSVDGVSWKQVGTTQTLTMAQNAYIGLAASADNNATLATDTFDNVSISSATAPAPVISGVSPASGFAGSQVVISGSGFGMSQGNSVVRLNGVLATVNSWSSSSITITVPTGATSGPLVVSVAPSMNDSNAVAFTVTPAPVPSFALSASPSSLTVAQGSNVTSTITVTPQNGFAGSVALSATGQPTGVSASFSPTGTTNTNTLTLTASSTATTGTFTITVTGTSGSLTNTTTISLTVAGPANGGLPANWADLDIGAVGLAGGATFSNGSFSLSGAGTSLWGNADGANFASRSMSGDGSIVARLLGGTASSTGGVMIRETLDPSSMSIFVGYFEGKVYANYRSVTGGMTSQDASSAVTLPSWVKLVRAGNAFSFYTSPDGFNWVQFGTAHTINMVQSAYAGLAVSSGNTTLLATNAFDSVSVSSATTPAPVIAGVSATTGSIGNQVGISGSGFGTSQGNSLALLNGSLVTVNSWSDTSITVTIPAGASSGPLLASVAPGMNSSNPVTFTVTPTPLPNKWLDQEIGQLGLVGSATYANGTFTLNASGQWIYSSADAMHFVYQPVSGDATIIARVVNAQGGGADNQAGVMIRETLDPASSNAFAEYEVGLIYSFVRPSPGASTTYMTDNVAVTLPYWVKLVRSGNNFSSYSSSDGLTWKQVGTTQTITMAQNVYIGLAASADNNAALATDTFDNVTITTP